MNIDPRMLKARTSLIIRHPFFGALAMYLKFEEDPQVETMATDGTTLFYSRTFLDEINELETIGVIAHEVRHCTNLHHIRMGNRNPDEWNIATDLAINRDLIREGFTLPKGALFDPQYNNGMGAEEIYARRMNKKQKQQQGQQGQGQSQGQGQPSQPQQQPGQSPSNGQPSQAAQPPQSQNGSGAGSPSQQPAQANAAGSDAQGSGKYGKDIGRCGRIIPAAPQHDQAALGEQQAEWERRIYQAAAVAKAANAGYMPGNIEEIIQQVGKPNTNWRDELRRYVDAQTRVDFAWTSPNKRFLSSGMVFPGMVKDGIAKVGFAADTSGSMDQGLLAQCVGEMRAAFEEGAIDELVVALADTRVHQTKVFTRGDEVNINAVGRGGTKFSPAIAWFMENHPDISLLIYFTDLDCNDFGPEPSFPIVWATCGYESVLAHKTAPFGDIIKLEL